MLLLSDDFETYYNISDAWKSVANEVAAVIKPYNIYDLVLPVRSYGA